MCWKLLCVRRVCVHYYGSVPCMFVVEFLGCTSPAPHAVALGQGMWIHPARVLLINSSVSVSG